MIKIFFDWLDHHPGSFWLIAFIATLGLLVHLVRLIKREYGDRPPATTAAPWRLDALLLFVFLLAWRWPFLFAADEFNPDESQLIAGAITLTHDPVFWRSVDGTTSGPLNFYALLPLHALGLPLDYFTARLTGLLLIGGALTFVWLALARSYDRATAWLGVLPVLAFFATVFHPDLLHYSSEHVPLLLIALPVWLLAGRGPAEGRRLYAACFIAGAAPWAKLQTAPLALVLMAWATWQIWSQPSAKRWTRTAWAGLAAIAPTFLTALLLLVTGQFGTALRRYFIHNLIYVSQNTDRTIGEALQRMKEASQFDGRVPLLLITTLTLTISTALWCALRRRRFSAFFLGGLALTMMAAFAVITPHREFLHYTLLLPIPLALWGGAAVGLWRQTLTGTRFRYVFAGGWLILGGLLPLVTRARQQVPAVYGRFAYDWRHPRSPVAMLVHALSGPQDSLGIWGWAPSLYVECKLPQATRDAHSVWSILPNEQQEYHRTTYLADLRQHAPAVFVDAVGPGAFAFEHRPQQQHEIFPALTDYVSANYALVRDLPEARIYARKDNPRLAALTTYQIDLLLAKGRRAHSPSILPPTITPLEQLAKKSLDGRSVTMVLPPTTVEWPLDADVRSITLEYGFDPEAYERGNSNGAEIILELANLTQSRQIYRRLLNPSHEAKDRGLQSTKVNLPPFGPGTHLILRTTAGPFGDNAWDWVYLAGLEYHRSPGFLPTQFPGFNRAPDVANAEVAGFISGTDGEQLMLNAPATLAYLLTGKERRLQFEYGFLPGAYRDGGHTDGAEFRVALQHPGQADQILFHRLLNPGRNSADRGTQLLQLTLPQFQAGDRLVISIDPGPTGNAAWDWTYIHPLTLE